MWGAAILTGLLEKRVFGGEFVKKYIILLLIDNIHFIIY